MVNKKTLTVGEKVLIIGKHPQAGEMGEIIAIEQEVGLFEKSIFQIKLNNNIGCYVFDSNNLERCFYKKQESFKKIDKWEEHHVSGSKRTNISKSDWLDDWFYGFGKDEGCTFEGTWWDMICFARNILASKNTEKAAPEFYMPELESDNYTGEDTPYEYIGD